MIRHHPPIEKLSNFAAGSLSMSQAVCISAHLEHCGQCRRQLGRLELLGAELFVNNDHQDRDDAIKQQLMSRLDDLQPGFSAGPDDAPIEISELVFRKVNSSPKGVPNCLRSMVDTGLDQLEWKRLTPSIQSAKLCTDVNGTRVELIKIKPGGKVASHNHTGEEVTTVLQGSFSDASGVYTKGDIIYRGPEHKNHHPRASQDTECICLTAVEAPIQFTGIISRVLNPLMRKGHQAR